MLRDEGYERQRVTLTNLIRHAALEWHGVKLHRPDWSTHSHTIAFTVRLRAERLRIHFILNAYWEALEFELPPPDEDGATHWRRWIDTALDSPNDIVPWQSAPAWLDRLYRAEPRSVVVLFASKTVVPRAASA